MKILLALALNIALAASCSKSQATEPRTSPGASDAERPGAGRPAPHGDSMSTQERVKQWAGAEATVMQYSDVTIDGVELYWVDLSRPHGRDRGYGVAVPAGSSDFLRGQEAMRALLDRGVSDPGVLAHLSMLLLETGGTPLLEAQGGDDEDALVAPPAIRDRVLEYWSEHRTASAPGLRRSRLDLNTLAVESVSAQELLREAADPVEVAQGWLASSSTAMHTMGLDQLARHCQDPRAVALLQETLQSHAQRATRGGAAQRLGACRDRGSVRALIAALEGDGESEVRWKAAAALGAIGDGAARPALEKASRDADVAVQHAATQALKQLAAP